jgi:ubiquinone/menaquinone biosynthesis C-methylase UbiE
MELSTDLILGKVLTLSQPVLLGGSTHLDIGAGTGALIRSIREAHPNVKTFACDYTDCLMKVENQQVEIANLNEDALPYASSTFDLVTCTEVIEHLENYRKLIREVFRVTKPGGTAIFTSPNVLNLQSRLRFFYFGFWNLFGPLPVGRAESYSTVGHITPVSYFYLAHALAEAGFTVERLEIDKPQRSAVAKVWLYWPFIQLFGLLARRREVRRYRTIDKTNIDIVRRMNSLPMLLGRTIIVVAVRKSGPQQQNPADVPASALLQQRRG